jgi:hypothetical protein
MNSIGFHISIRGADYAQPLALPHLDFFMITPMYLVFEKRCTVNIYRYKTKEANGNTGVIPTTSKFFSLYQEFF